MKFEKVLTLLSYLLCGLLFLRPGDEGGLPTVHREVRRVGRVIIGVAVGARVVRHVY